MARQNFTYAASHSNKIQRFWNLLNLLVALILLHSFPVNGVELRLFDTYLRLFPLSTWASGAWSNSTTGFPVRLTQRHRPSCVLNASVKYFSPLCSLAFWHSRYLRVLMYYFACFLDCPLVLKALLLSVVCGSWSPPWSLVLIGCRYCLLHSFGKRLSRTFDQRT